MYLNGLRFWLRFNYWDTVLYARLYFTPVRQVAFHHTYIYCTNNVIISNIKTLSLSQQWQHWWQLNHSSNCHDWQHDIMLQNKHVNNRLKLFNALKFWGHTDTHMFNGVFSRTISISRHQKIKPFWISMKQEMTGWQWHQLGHMQIICTTPQTDNHASISSHNLLQPDALHDAKPTMPVCEGKIKKKIKLNYGCPA